MTEEQRQKLLRADPTGWSVLTDEEWLRIDVVHQDWVASRAEKNYARADRLRGYLERSGCLGPNFDMWHPVFESPAHRQRRILERLQ